MHRLRLISIQHTELRRVCEHICDKLIVYTRTICIYAPMYTGAHICIYTMYIVLVHTYIQYSHLSIPCQP